MQVPITLTDRDNSISKSTLSLGLFAVALAMRLWYLKQSAGNPQLYIPLVDEEYYVNFGHKLAAGNWQGEPGAFFLDPLYGYFLGIVFALFGDNLLIPRLIQLLIDSFNAVILFSIGQSLWQRQAGLVAGLLYALFPIAWFHALTLLKPTLTTSLLLIVVWCFIRLQNAFPVRGLLLTGFVSGLATLLSGSLILLLPFGAGIIAYYQGINRSALKSMLILLIGASLSLAPCGIRNLAMGGVFAVLPGNGGTTFYSVNNPENPEGNYKPPSFITLNHPAELARQYREEAERRLSRPLTDKETSAYWFGQAVNYLFSDPAVIPKLLWEKSKQLLGRYEIPNNNALEINAEFAPILMPGVPQFSIIMAIGIPGLIIGLSVNRRALPVLLPVAVVVVTSLLYYSAARFRFPMIPAFMLGIGALASTFQSFSKSLWKISLIAFSAVALFFISYRITPLNGSLNPLYLNQAIAYARLGEFQYANRVLDKLTGSMSNDSKYYQIRLYVDLLEKNYASAYRNGLIGLSIAPNNPELLLGSGEAAVETQRFNEALTILRSPEIRKEDTTVKLYWLGRAYTALGNPQRAEELYKKALEEKPLSHDIMEKLQIAVDNLPH